MPDVLRRLRRDEQFVTRFVSEIPHHISVLLAKAVFIPSLFLSGSSASCVCTVQSIRRLMTAMRRMMTNCDVLVNRNGNSRSPWILVDRVELNETSPLSFRE